MKKILIVEDEENVRGLIKETLGFLNKYEIHEAGTGREALEKIKELKNVDIEVVDFIFAEQANELLKNQ